MSRMSSPEEVIAHAMASWRSSLLVMHVTPDGDTIGSALALGWALRSLGQKVTWACQDPIPERYQFLPGAREIHAFESLGRSKFDGLVMVDCGDRGRAGALPDFTCQVVNIDHHRGNPQFGELNWIDGDAAATGEMIFDLVSRLGVSLTPDIAVCLYVAISTDTLSFRQINTTPKTFWMVHKLTEQDFDLARANQSLWETESLSELHLVGWALSHLQVSDDGRVAWVAVPRQVMEELQARDEDVDVLVHHLRSIDTVGVAVVTKEMEDGERIKISFRGKLDVDVSAYAAAFGGGGHRYAAAAVTEGSLAEVTAKVLDRLGALP